MNALIPSGYYPITTLSELDNTQENTLIEGAMFSTNPSQNCWIYATGSPKYDYVPKGWSNGGLILFTQNTLAPKQSVVKAIETVIQEWYSLNSYYLKTLDRVDGNLQWTIEAIEELNFIHDNLLHKIQETVAEIDTSR